MEGLLYGAVKSRDIVLLFLLAGGRKTYCRAGGSYARYAGL